MITYTYKGIFAEILKLSASCFIFIYIQEISREFFFAHLFFAHLIFAHPHFFHFRANLIFAQRQKKFGFARLKHPKCWYLVREKTTTQNMSFKNRAILFSRTFSCANHSKSRGLCIRAGALRENKTHAKIS